MNKKPAFNKPMETKKIQFYSNSQKASWITNPKGVSPDYLKNKSNKKSNNYLPPVQQNIFLEEEKQITKKNTSVPNRKPQVNFHEQMSKSRNFVEQNDSKNNSRYKTITLTSTPHEPEEMNQYKKKPNEKLKKITELKSEKIVEEESKDDDCLNFQVTNKELLTENLDLKLHNETLVKEKKILDELKPTLLREYSAFKELRDNNNINKETETIKFLCDDFKNMKNYYSQIIQSKEVEIQKMKKETEQNLKDYKKSELIMNEKLSKFQSLMKENEEYRRNNVQFTNDLNEAKKSHEKDKNAYSEEKNSLETEILKLKNENKRLSGLLDSKLESNQKKNFDKEKEIMQSLIKNLENDLNIKKIEVARLQQDFCSEKKNNELEIFRNLSEKLTAENEDLKVKIKTLLMG